MSHPQSHLLQLLSWRPASGLLRHRPRGAREEAPAGPARMPLISAHRHTLPPGRSARVWGAKACGGHLWPGATAWVASRLLPTHLCPFADSSASPVLRPLRSSWQDWAPGAPAGGHLAPLSSCLPSCPLPTLRPAFLPPGITRTPKLYARRLLSQAVLQGDPAWGVATAF